MAMESSPNTADTVKVPMTYSQPSTPDAKGTSPGKRVKVWTK